MYILSYKRDLWKLQGDKNKARKFYGELIARAEEENRSEDEITHLISEEIDSVRELEDKIIEIQVRFLTKQAEKYLVQIPEFSLTDGTWEQSKITGRVRWTQKTISNVKTAIREEQKYRREYWQGWFAMFIGALGALIGVLSLA